MSKVLTSDRRATREEVVAHRVQLRRLASAAGLEAPRLADDGVLIVHAPERGYRAVVTFAGEATALVGPWVHVITDDVPAAEAQSEPL